MSKSVADAVAEQLGRLVEIAHELGMDGEDPEFTAKLESIARLRSMFSEDAAPDLVGTS